MTAYTPEQIARVCHDANRALQMIDADPAPSAPWDAETDETRESAISGVLAALKGVTPEELHGEWVRHKAAAGWVYGPVKDPEARTHPCMVPYSELPPEQRVKDAVFTAIVRAMSGEGGGIRPRPGEPGWHDVTCGVCGEESSTNFRVGEIECGECEARRCPHCGGWFGGEQ